MVRTNQLTIHSRESSNFPSIGSKIKIPLEAKERYIDIHQPLIDACRNNDAQAQKELYQQYCVATFNTCKRMVGNREDAQDVLQETFIAAFKGLDKFSGKSTFGAWLKRIAINKCINHLKGQKSVQFERWTGQTEGESISDSENAAEISTEVINEAILKLPDGCRMVFVMKTLEGYDHKEIAEALSVSIGTSKSQFNRARVLLQESLKDARK